VRRAVKTTAFVVRRTELTTLSIINHPRLYGRLLLELFDNNSIDVDMGGTNIREVCVQALGVGEMRNCGK